MKKGNGKRNFDKFKKREATKRKSSRDALRRIVEGLGYDAHGVRIVDREERAYHRAKKGASESTRIAEGEFILSRSGYGFVRIEGEERDVFVPAGDTLSAMSGDLVEVHYRAFRAHDGTEKTEGKIKRILKYQTTSFAGTLKRNPYHRTGSRVHPPYLVVPDDGKMPMEIPVASAAGAKIGDKVFVKLSRSGGLHGEIVASFGKSESKEANYRAILAEEGIVESFGEKALGEAEARAALAIDALDTGERRSLTHLTVMTIDGAHAKDLDDAISLVRLPGERWQLGVHIADVSAYVTEKSALEREAFARGTSVYFTDRVVPMLPPVLSNGACSLNAGEEKATLSCFITLSKTGEILKKSIEMTTIVSKKRGVYSEVNDLFENGKHSPFYTQYKEVYPTLMRMHELYLVLLQKSKARGAVELESAERLILLDAEGNPTEVIPVVRGDGERMIEQFMLLANEAVATALREKGIPLVYRIHEDPLVGKMQDFLLFMQNLGIPTTHIDPSKPRGEQLNALLSAAKEKEMGECVSYMLLRSLSKAKYSEIHHEHFGLGIENYCHFTSPIRRLSDLATHRIIHKVLFEGAPAQKYASYARRAAAAATESELRAVSAERRIERLYEAIYMSRFIGEHFPARIVSIQSFGMFCALENGIEGLLPIDDLIGSYFFDEKNLTLYSYKHTYRIGDPIEVELVECDLIHGRLRFAPW